MSHSLYRFIRPLLFTLNPETAHHLALKTARHLSHLTYGKKILTQAVPDDPITLMGLTFKNRVGLAAGLDKNGEYIDALALFGFGFIEVGTVTPLPQDGKPRPRLFRLPQAQALINRMGFNNQGLKQFLQNVRVSHFQANGGILGLNIGKNAATPMERAVDDYVTGLMAVYPHADYITINISSPNTANLRSLQGGDELSQLLQRLHHTRTELADQYQQYKPIVVKIAPDLSSEQIDTIAHLLPLYHIDGVIATNTTLSREAVQHLPHGQEEGGLSGAPLLQASNAVIRQLRQALGPDFPIIGVGGINSGADARSKLEAGANVVQIYSGLIYHGPQLVADCIQHCRA